MSHPRRRRRPEPLSQGAIDHLARALRRVGRATALAHDRKTRRLALTFRPCRRGDDALPAEPVPLDRFRLFALAHRWVERDGRIAPLLALAIFRAEAELPGTGRIRLAREATLDVGGRGGRLAPDPAANPTAARAALLMVEAVEDLARREPAAEVRLPRLYYAFDDRRPPVAEAGIDPAAWAREAVRIGNRPAWPAEFFARDERSRWSTHPVDGSANPWQGGPGGSPEGLIRGSWILRDGVPTPMAQEPAAVYADLAGLVGRTVRNPSFPVLQARGILPEHLTYRQWLEAISPMTREGVRTPVDRAPGGRGRAFLDGLDEWLGADPDHASALLDDLQDACHAVGVPLPSDPEQVSEALADLVEAPWQRVEVPGAAAIQQVRLADGPVPGNMSFALGAVRADLYDLGPLAGHYQPVDHRRIREVLGQW